MTSETSDSTLETEIALQTLLVVEHDENIGELLVQALKRETPYAVLH